ncbi:hypothetical protein [Bacillus niameyensis]|uniref:hypothetical protein n=1 Tax=Bacillus niameyensis TaxID=1522308 RepID=UPI000783E047|nr:hypothetical protein [Bacillus niameyensis]
MMQLDSKISLYFVCILAGFAVLGLLLFPGVTVLLGVVANVLKTIGIIVILLFAALIILKGLISLFNNARL